MSTFAILAGVIGIIFSVIGTGLACCIIPIKDPMNDKRNARGQYAWIFFTSLVYGIISIIGLVNYG